ncbi:MAG: extracellular solute-binding protein [Chloroflexi bacterium]|nr:extracellular solute-binding protein [Chloroflexota bacterium]
MIPMLVVAARTVMYNTEMVKPEEIDSYKDLLRPRFVGQITLLDPADGGAGSGLINHFVSVLGWDEALRYTRDLLVQQKAVIFRDARLQVETVARGKYSIVLGGSGQYKTDFIKLGATVAVKIPREGDYATASFGALAAPVKPAHPNAATVFVNWLLTREGQSIFARGAGGPSRRLDVSTEGIDPVFVASPDEKIIQGDSPEINLRRPQVVEAVRKMLGEIQK